MNVFRKTVACGNSLILAVQMTVDFTMCVFQHATEA